MTSEARTPEEYLSSLPDDRKALVGKLRQVILDKLPEGFEECMGYGMLAYVVPLRLYPAGYHCDPSKPLPFLSLASQKNAISLYHMGLYADEQLLEWYRTEYLKATGKKADAGKSCIRFKKEADIQFDLIGTLVSKMTPSDWIRQYESAFRK